MLQRLLAVAMIAGALAAPLPLFASVCEPHSCCGPANALALDQPDCCPPMVCAAPDPESPAAVPSATQLVTIQTEADLGLVEASVAAVPMALEVTNDSPPLTRIRLARLSTLLI